MAAVAIPRAMNCDRSAGRAAANSREVERIAGIVGWSGRWSLLYNQLDQYNSSFNVSRFHYSLVL